MLDGPSYDFNDRARCVRKSEHSGDAQQSWTCTDRFAVGREFGTRAVRTDAIIISAQNFAESVIDVDNRMRIMASPNIDSSTLAPYL